jgi:hypothetical protein
VARCDWVTISVESLLAALNTSGSASAPVGGSEAASRKTTSALGSADLDAMLEAAVVRARKVRRMVLVVVGTLDMATLIGVTPAEFGFIEQPHAAH